MLCKQAKSLNKHLVVLASQSPRRLALFRENIGIHCEVIISGFAENIDKSSCGSAEEYVLRTARQKNDAVVELICGGVQRVPVVVVSADTIVVSSEDEILEKPASKLEAYQMLRRLSGRQHFVMTAVSIAIRDGVDWGNETFQPTGSVHYTVSSFVEKTQVTFCELSDSAISEYVETGEPMDKAGGYGIQSLGASFVSNINGCYFNVVGFPVHRFARELQKLIPELQ